MNPIEEYLTLVNQESRQDSFYYDIERLLTDPDSLRAIANHAYRDLLEWARIYGPLQLGTRLFDPLFFGVIQNPHVRVFECSVHETTDSAVGSVYEFVTRPNGGKGRLKILMTVLKDNDVSRLLDRISKYLFALPGLTTHGLMFPVGPSSEGDPGGSKSSVPTCCWSLFHVSEDSVFERIEESADQVKNAWKE